MTTAIRMSRKMHSSDENSHEDTGGDIISRYRSLVEDSSFGFFVFQVQSGHFLFLNSRACAMLGYSAQEAESMHAWEMVLPDERAVFIDRLDRLVQGHKLVPDRMTYTLLRKDLTTFRAEITKHAGLFEGMPVVHGTIKDVTDYEAFQRKLEKAQRLDTIAVMADGVADQLLKAVAVIQDNLGNLTAQGPESGNFQKYIAQIKGAGHQINSLTHKLLCFSRGGAFQPEPIEVNAFISELMPLFRHTLKPTVQISFDPSNQPLWILAAAANLQTLLSAVIANAEEAIAGKGRIVVSTAEKEIADHWGLTLPDLKAGRYAVVKIRDNGAGMNAYVKSRVCEPYFTTKFHGRGLGMAAAYGIVKRHNGWLSIDSWENRGTEVSIYLPLTDTPGEGRTEVCAKENQV